MEGGAVVPGPRPPGQLRQPGLPRLAIVGGIGLVAIAAAWLLRSGPWAEAARPSPAARAAFQEETGIRVIRVALMGGTGLVDFRYQVIDPDKAPVVHDQPPILVDEESGEIIDTLFMNHKHGNQPKAGYTYPVILVNEQGILERGDAVSVVIGDARLEHLAVM